MTLRNPSAEPPLPELRLLGPMTLSLAGRDVALPRSKKCRALLAYLALTGRPHRRERLIDLLWDVADDPRGALRWTLSRVRSVLPDVELLAADRESVGLRMDAVDIDALELMRGEKSLQELPTEELTRMAGTYRGELMEGLELPDFLDFTAFCVAERENHRRAFCGLLHALIDRNQDDPAAALPWARRLVQVDAFSVDAHQDLLRLLFAEGYREEAERRFEHTHRQFQQVNEPEAEHLAAAFRALRSVQRGRGSVPVTAVSVEKPAVETVVPVAPAQRVRSSVPDPGGAPTPFVGRARPLAELSGLLHSTWEVRGRAAALVTAEPGAGKSRLLERMSGEAQADGWTVLSARAFDLARGRPFGPWIDALGVEPDALAQPSDGGGQARVFERIVSLVGERTASGGGTVLVFDDIQWLDPDSAAALHHLLQTDRGVPLVVLMAVRLGELSDNPAMERVVRSLRRDRLLREVELSPFSAEELGAMVGASGPELTRLCQASAGNPLYALELARGAGDGGQDAAPKSLSQLVQERVSRLSDAAQDVLRWAAVLGHGSDAMRLSALSGLSQLQLVDALEELEGRALLRADAARSHERYVFGHDVVREAVYAGLSHPRRRLMHRKLAHLLDEQSSEPATAHELVRHACLGGEVELGVRACAAAARYALRICANADAEALAKRGLHHAEELEEAARVAASIDLLHVLYSARTPDHAEATKRVSGLAERALDLGLTKPARLGFQMLSYLRWESASMSDAHSNILQAERVSRSEEPAERSQALAHAARCLVLLERNLGQAEAFMMEAKGVSQRNGCESAAVAFALAMIAAHRGEREAADVAFQEAQYLARASGERLAEYGALQHRVMLAIDARAPDAVGLAEQLTGLSERVRPGAEVVAARALYALAVATCGESASASLDEAVEALRCADAKFELAFVLTRWAYWALQAGDTEGACAIAQEAYTTAKVLGRLSERTLAALLLLDAACPQGDDLQRSEMLQELGAVVEADLSAVARAALERSRHATQGG